MPATPRRPDQPSVPVRPPRRRTPGLASRAGSGSGPGRAGSAARSKRPSQSTGSATGRALSSGSTRVAPPAAKPRLTGRAAILVLVLAVLAVSYASSLRAYLQQRGEIESLQSTISERQSEIDDLEQEKSRWLDPEYVRTEARERLGYVLPGETPFVALRDGEPLTAESELTDPATIAVSAPTAFWDDAWETMRLAGHPPRRADPPPLTRIKDPSGTSE